MRSIGEAKAWRRIAEDVSGGGRIRAHPALTNDMEVRLFGVVWEGTMDTPYTPCFRVLLCLFLALECEEESRARN